MAIQIEKISPIDGATEIPLNAEIVFRVYDDGAAPLDTATLDLTVDDGDTSELAINNGVFDNDWTGEIIDNSVNNSDLTVIATRPISSPDFPDGREINITVDIDLV